MSYYFTKKVNSDFETSIMEVTEKLKEKGFGVLTEIDVQSTLKKKIDVDFYKYRILGACNPHFAHKALLEEDKVGVMLPCNVIVQQKSDSEQVEVSAVDPIASMSAIQNENLGGIANEVQQLLKSVIDEL
ncbi:MAG: DUF302 domain-containing protein [Bacteriovoracaceae bacterium]|jgi:uncharacterized protein (DUF302 family)|nr:DUF302 domain-containing protein [Bacteriovoracaceae bacterium]